MTILVPGDFGTSLGFTRPLPLRPELREQQRNESAPVYLDDMQEETSHIEGSSLKKFDAKMSLGGKLAKHYLFTHPRADRRGYATYNLDKQFAEFRASVGLGDAIPQPAASPLAFMVIGDGKVLWQSKPVQVKGKVQECVADIRGVKTLTVQAVSTGPPNWAHALWDQPRIYKTFQLADKPVDLLKLIRPDKDAVKGKWSFQGDTLISPADALARVKIPYEPPEEYDLTVVTERKTGNNSLVVGLMVGGRQCQAELDGDWPVHGIGSVVRSARPL